MARHIFHCPLRWGDMDAYGHINNVVYLRYLEEARVDLMFRLGERLEGPRFASGCVVARHEIDYLRPMAHGFGAVTIETWVTKMTAASISLSYEVSLVPIFATGEVATGAPVTVVEPQIGLASELRA